MTTLFGIGFATPWLLLALLALPLLWLILRAVPPAPLRRVFPGITLLLGLEDDESLSDRTPWWLLLLRMLAVAAIILGLAGPVLNPARDTAGSGPLLVVLDASWAGAADWEKTRARLDTELAEAGRAGRTVAVLRLTAPEPLQFQAASAWRSRIAGLDPQPWLPSGTQLAEAAELISAAGGSFDSLWFDDGLDYPDRAALARALQDRGDLLVIQTGGSPLGLKPAQFADGAIELTALRSWGGSPQDISLIARGPDPGGTLRSLATASVTFAEGETEAATRLNLPPELRGRITRFEIAGQRAAGAVALADDSLRRREIALITSQSGNEGLALLSPLHYLRKALAPTADLFEGSLSTLLPAKPDVVVLADVASIPPAEEAALTAWVEDGGLLLRFAGPRLAASDIAREDDHPLMPLRLRSGGRSIGGAMSWGEPKKLAPFAEGSPFFGLTVPEEVTVTSQVVAQPGPDLANRVIAELRDGTPLVTRKETGKGQIVLFHVTANAEWSSLPLSGLFVGMLERLAVSSAARAPEAEELEGTTWTPVAVLDGFGRIQDAGTLGGVPGPDLISLPPGPALRPGLYQAGNRSLARNVLTADSSLAASAWPAGITVSRSEAAPEQPLGGWLLSLALLLLAADILASLLLSGRLHASRAASLVLVLTLAGSLAAPGQARAQGLLPAAASELTLAHVLTGNSDLDALARAGLQGLSNTLYFRTSVEPAAPEGVDLERDELAFYPLLYWPITPDQPRPSAEAYAKLNAYLQAGGMVLFDTRDADLAQAGATSPNARKLQSLARALDIPPLEPLPEDHVLTRTFYLLQSFPGRHARGPVWVEAAPPDAEQIEGIPFRNLNDGVTPVVIGGNDWASAWAVDQGGRPLYPVGRGFGGERQRELAYRFGINLVMHVLTGNYKSDQVHVPALLDRLGQ
jgi:hypothetical protein